MSNVLRDDAPTKGQLKELLRQHFKKAGNGILVSIATPPPNDNGKKWDNDTGPLIDGSGSILREDASWRTYQKSGFGYVWHPGENEKVGICGYAQTASTISRATNGLLDRCGVYGIAGIPLQWLLVLVIATLWAIVFAYRSRSASYADAFCTSLWILVLVWIIWIIDSLVKMPVQPKRVHGYMPNNAFNSVLRDGSVHYGCPRADYKSKYVLLICIW